jgi:hypothetical protein
MKMTLGRSAAEVFGKERTRDISVAASPRWTELKRVFMINAKKFC